MTERAAPPRRRRVPGKDNTGIYERPDGRYEIGFQDADDRVRWRGPFDGIIAARKARAQEVAKAAQGQRIAGDPRMLFATAAELWWEAHAMAKREATRDIYRRHLDAQVVRRSLSAASRSRRRRGRAICSIELASGAAAWSIKGHLTVLSSIFRYAIRRLGFEGPIRCRCSNGESGRAPARRRSAASTRDGARADPGRDERTVEHAFPARRYRRRTGERLLALWWENLELGDLDAATIRFTHQVDRSGARVPA